MPWKSTVKWGIIGRNPPVGPQFGATQKKFFLGVEAGFEYSYVFQNGWEFSLIQKNNVNFLHGDTFRNGLLLGVKIPF